MKNVHILPTDKPSRFYFNNNDNCYQLSQLEKKSTPLKINQNIYITSDEEIKNCWVFNIFHNSVYFLSGNYGLQPISKKIILTTDQELINDGIQALTDEQIMEYINNPVDYVEVKHVTKEYVDDQDAYGYDVNYYSVSFSREKELPLLPYEYKPEDCLQETLEEAIERLESDYNVLGNDFSNGFYEGVEYQAERMYSEEDLKKAFDASNEGWVNFDFWFNQFKKK